jgi:hypothetical protein
MFVFRTRVQRHWTVHRSAEPTGNMNGPGLGSDRDSAPKMRLCYAPDTGELLDSGETPLCGANSEHI